MSANSYFLAFLKSFGLHIAIGVTLVASASFTAIKKPTPPVINVEPIESVAIDQNKLNEQINKIKTERNNQRRAEEKRVKDLEERATRAQQKRRTEENKIKDLNKKTRQSNAERRKAEQAAATAKKKQRQEADKAKRLAAQTEKKRQEKLKAEQEAAAAKKRKLKAIEDERKAEAARKEKSRQDKIAREKKAREERERREAELALQQQMAEEQAARERAHSKQVLSEVDKFKALIQQRIKASTRVDQSLKGKECQFTIRLASTGFVTKFDRRGGDPIVCNAVETAVLQQDKLPMSKDPAVFEKLKIIRITFIADPDS